MKRLSIWLRLISFTLSAMTTSVVVTGCGGAPGAAVGGPPATIYGYWILPPASQHRAPGVRYQTAAILTLSPTQMTLTNQCRVDQYNFFDNTAASPIEVRGNQLRVLRPGQGRVYPGHLECNADILADVKTVFLQSPNQLVIQDPVLGRTSVLIRAQSPNVNNIPYVRATPGY